MPRNLQAKGSDLSKELKRIRRNAVPIVKEARRILRKYMDSLPSQQLQPLVEGIGHFEQALEKQDAEKARSAIDGLDALLDGEFAFARKSALRDWAESLFFALMIALFLRTFVVEAFKIPSGSMIPTLHVGDHIFVSKFIYGIRVPFLGNYIASWGEPERGEVIVFVYPNDPSKDYIKRVIGVPGDVVRVDGTEVYVNGKPIVHGAGVPAQYTDETSGMERTAMEYRCEHGEAEFDVLYEQRRRPPPAEYKVEPGHFFVMGDNRDNSADSRVWGFVPMENVKGRALIVWWSSSERQGLKFSRIGHVIE